MFHNNETAAMLVFQTNPVGVQPGTRLRSGEKGNKQGQIGKISESEARKAVSPDLLFSIFSPFSHNAEPGPRLVGVELFCYLLMKKFSFVPINLHSCWPRE